jgi:hydroxypyruvate isomerase
MPKFAANLTMLWPELDVYDRFRAAADAGFARVEILFVYPLDLSRVERLLHELRLELVLFDPRPGDWDSGERGLACNPGREADFDASVREGLDAANRLGVARLNVLTGIPAPGVSEDEAHRLIVENLASVAPLAAERGVKLVIENINNTDFPGYYVNTAARAAEIIREVGHPGLRLQLDQYHVGMMGGDARGVLRTFADLVEHAQIADVPGRHQPGTGQQPIPEFLQDLDAVGYQGSVGLEYRPAGSTETALAWLPRDRRG